MRCDHAKPLRVHTRPVPFAFLNKKVSELNVVGLAYRVGTQRISCSTMRANSDVEHEDLGALDEFLEPIDAVRDGLARTTDVARGRVSALRRFVEDSGTRLLPRSVRKHPPDVVVIPQAALHGAPLHLIHTDDGLPLGAQAGVVYASSMSEFVLCSRRNSHRRGELAQLSVSMRPDETALSPEVAIYCGDVLGRDTDGFQSIKSAILKATGAEKIFEAAGRADIKAIMDAWTSRKNQAALQPSSGPEQVPVGVASGSGDKARDELRRAQVLVIIAHGYVDPVNHERSGVLVGDMAMAHRGIGCVRWFGATLPDGTQLHQADVPFCLPPPGGMSRQAPRP